MTATPAKSTPELIPSVSQALCFCTPHGLQRAQSTPITQYRLYCRERKEHPTACSGSILCHKKGEWLPAAESVSMHRRLPKASRFWKHFCASWGTHTLLNHPSQTASAHPLNCSVSLLCLPGQDSCRQTKGSCDAGRAAGDTLPG